MTMRVLFTTNQSIAFHHGGVRTQMLQTKTALEELGASVTFFEMWKDWDLKQFDIVHIFTANMATYHFARALRVRNIPFVVSPVFFTQRSFRIIRSVIGIDRFLNRFARGLWTDYGIVSELCNWADAVLPNTSAERKLLIEGMKIPRENVHIVCNGVEERFAKSSADLFIRNYGIQDFILYVGQIGAHRKNVLQLLRALERIDHPAVIIGSVDNSPMGIRCMKRAEKNSRLLVIDELAHDSMLLASAYAACKVFASPSLFETPGIAAMEAALAGANIVITPIGGTTDYFQDDAFYVNPSSVDDIERGILEALKCPKSTTLGKRIGDNFSWSKVGEQTKNVYEIVLNKH